MIVSSNARRAKVTQTEPSDDSIELSVDESRMVFRSPYEPEKAPLVESFCDTAGASSPVLPE